MAQRGHNLARVTQPIASRIEILIHCASESLLLTTHPTLEHWRDVLQGTNLGGQRWEGEHTGTKSLNQNAYCTSEETGQVIGLTWASVSQMADPGLQEAKCKLSPLLLSLPASSSTSFLPFRIPIFLWGSLKSLSHGSPGLLTSWSGTRDPAPHVHVSGWSF